jgi:hypothetical protein
MNTDEGVLNVWLITAGLIGADTKSTIGSLSGAAALQIADAGAGEDAESRQQ